MTLVEDLKRDESFSTVPYFGSGGCATIGCGLAASRDYD
jgi:hypothetical protein